jgi:hypothetical protein
MKSAFWTKRGVAGDVLHKRNSDSPGKIVFKFGK